MADNGSDPIESSHQDQQTDQCTSETFTSSDNSESNTDDFDHGIENDSSKSPASMTTNYSSILRSNRTAGVLSSPPLANNPFAVKTTTATKSIADSTDNKEGRPIVAPATFTPSRFFTDTEQARGNCSSSSFKLKPAVLANPFAKCDSLSEKRNDCPGEVSTSKEIDWSDDSAQESNSVLGAGSNFAPGGHISSSFACSTTTSNSTTTTSALATNNNNTANRHTYQPENNHSLTTLSSLPHLTAPSTSLVPPVAIPSDATGNINFVFGQKMNERVRQSGCSNPQNSTSPTANGTTLPTFDHSPDQREQEEEKLANGEPAKSKSLHESAQEYESRKVKRTYDEVLVVTGEEEESNVLQVNCKLFAFDKTTSSWMERGRGLLRLNDKEESAAHPNEGALQSRLVMRTQGSLRVVLNTKVWRGMTIERPSPKSVQITAVDGDGVKVFLIMASPKDAEQLYSALNWRVTTLKTMEDQLPRQRFASGGCPKASGSVNEEALNCQPSTTTSDDSSSSPKRRRVMGPDQQLDDSDSNEFGTNIQDTSIDSTSRNKSNTFEADSGNLSSSSL